MAVQVPLAGSYSSAPSLPVTSTLPSRSNVAVLTVAAMTIFPVAVQVPLAGSYTSAPLIGVVRVGSSTSPTSTLPSRSNVAGKPRAA